jgi:thioredoxin reductase
MLKTDIVIIGAGPSGLAAADIIGAYDLDLVIIDEQSRPGGQIYRQPPEGFMVNNWLSSRIYADGKKLLEKVSQTGKIKWYTQTTVLGIAKSNNIESDYIHTVTICNNTGVKNIEAKCILIAPGCYDMPIIFPGWNLPGVMATGGIQAFVKSQQIIPGEQFLFVGTHPLQLIVADQIIKAGGKVTAVIFAQSFFKFLSILKSPVVLFRNIEKLLYISTIIIRLIKAGVSIRFNETVIEANGDDALESVRITAIDSSGKIKKGTERRIECDKLGVCFSFLSSSELARQCGTEYLWAAESGGWIIKHDEWMSTNIPGIYVAGEITGVAGAEVAAAEGELAGLGILYYLGKLDLKQVFQLSKSVRNKLKHLNQFADILKKLSYPGKLFFTQLLTDSSILCKCEEISFGEFKDHLENNQHVSSANAAKLLSRTGMGLCQGRYCHYLITQLLAEHFSKSEQEIGSFTARFPSKPTVIRHLIS